MLFTQRERSKDHAYRAPAQFSKCVYVCVCETEREFACVCLLKWVYSNGKEDQECLEADPVG